MAALSVALVYTMGCKPAAKTPSQVHNSPAPAKPDWSVPKRYQGKLIASRLKGFPDKLVALTLDDGPNAEVTPRDLDSLKAHGIHATFFVRGDMAKAHPELLKQIVDQGNVIGNHTYHHMPDASPEKSKKEVEDTDAIVFKATGQHCTCFRPPTGKTNGGPSKYALKTGYAVVTWTRSAADTATRDPEAILSNTVPHPHPGEIILMHDGAGHSPTADALPRMIEGLRAEGFSFVTLPELLRAQDEWLKSNQTGKEPGKR